MALTVAAACTGSIPPALELGAPNAAPATTSPPAPLDGAVVDPPGVRRVALGHNRFETPSFSLRPLPGRRSVLAVADEPRRALVQRVGVGATGIRPLDGRHLAAGFDGGGPLRLVTSDGTTLCLEAWEPEASSSCTRARPGAVVELGGEVVMLEEHVPEPDRSSTPEPKKAEREKAEPEKAEPRKAEPKKPRKKPRKRPRKKPRAESPPPPKPTRVELWLRRFDGTEPTSTGLAFDRPLPGMGLVDAVSIDGGLAVSWFEHVPHPRERRARLRAGRLDMDGKLVADSPVTIYEGPRAWGYVEGHLQSRLFSNGKAWFAGRLGGKGGGYEGAQLFPLRSVDVPAAIAQADPLRIAGGPLKTTETTGFEQLLASSPSLLPGQPSTDLERVAWVGDEGYMQRDGALFRVDRAGGASALEHPFTFARARLNAGWLALDGGALALTPEGWLLVDQNLDPAPPVSSPSTSAIDHEAARVAGSWWALEPAADGFELREVGAAGRVVALPEALHPDTTALVGGSAGGFVLAWHVASGAELSLYAWGGSDARLVARVPAPFGPGFGAVPRAAGGAIVAGTDETGSVVVLAFDETGRAGEARVVEGLTPLPSLVALPGGGAWLVDAGAAEVVWLDDDGKPVARRPWPSSDSGARCVDGAPLRRRLPAVAPGDFVELGTLAGPLACASGLPGWARDGSLRWFGSRSDGLTSAAELVVVPPEVLGIVPAAPSGTVPDVPAPRGEPTAASTACPPDMVHVADRFCVDRYESVLVDASTGVGVAPDYPPERASAALALAQWASQRLRVGDVQARAMPLPPLLAWPPATLRAVSRGGVLPAGYVSGLVARRACEQAAKRLCTLEELSTACRGEDDTQFPYGDSYEDGACNVFREAHPAALLHDNAAIGHLDPRLNHVASDLGPLARTTGGSPRCRSRWGEDAAYDLVGNLDEWADEKGGAFAGGFYARSTRQGCDAVITAHPEQYFDYSTGVRCCRDVR